MESDETELTVESTLQLAVGLTGKDDTLSRHPDTTDEERFVLMEAKFHENRLAQLKAEIASPFFEEMYGQQEQLLVKQQCEALQRLSLISSLRLNDLHRRFSLKCNGLH